MSSLLRWDEIGAWLKRQPPERKFCGGDPRCCLLVDFVKERHGKEVFITPSTVALASDTMKAASGPPDKRVAIFIRRWDQLTGTTDLDGVGTAFMALETWKNIDATAKR